MQRWRPETSAHSRFLGKLRISFTSPQLIFRGHPSRSEVGTEPIDQSRCPPAPSHPLWLAKNHRVTTHRPSTSGGGRRAGDAVFLRASRHGLAVRRQRSLQRQGTEALNNSDRQAAGSSVPNSEGPPAPRKLTATTASAAAAIMGAAEQGGLGMERQ